MSDNGDDLNLISEEKVVDSWPDDFPGITRFPETKPAKSLRFDSGDIALMNSLGDLAPGALVDEMKAMHSIACKLSIEESQERTRGKILRVLLE